MWGFSLTYPILAYFLYGEFLLHILRWLHFHAGSFSYTSRAGFLFYLGISLTHTVLALFFCGEILLHIPCQLLFFLFFFFSFFLFFKSGEFLLHIPCWIHFYAGRFSYTSRTGFIFIWGVSLTHPCLLLCVCVGGGGRGNLNYKFSMFF